MLPGRDWNEIKLSEDPAVTLLQSLGYTYVGPTTLEAERASRKEPLLLGRLTDAILRINRWLSPENAAKVARTLASTPSTSLLEASERLHNALTGGRTVEQDGLPSRTVHFFDFEVPANNEFVVTRQFEIKGTKKSIVPDVVVFVNGIPLAVIECKSPTIGKRWKFEAIEQLVRYQELDEKYREQGAPKLFETVQVLIAANGEEAFCGTVTTPYRFFAEWKTAWPNASSDAQASRQDVAIAGLLAPTNLLDILLNFVVFERDAATGRTVRKICRYQQFTAVNKALARLAGGSPTEGKAGGGGIIWHTQGSGKSLTMLWLALKLRRDRRHENPTIVLVTDRKDLDEQINKTFIACGFPNPEHATSVRDLRALLQAPPGKTILTTIHKFAELGTAASAPGVRTRPSGNATVSPDGKRLSGDEFPVLNDASNIFVLTDEAHRTQYGGLAGNMRRALPFASFFGFTGTPIDKNDRSTLSTFGSYIDTYTIEQAVADGATVPIFYEGRLAELRIVGSTLDALFERVFSDRSDEEREAIKKKYGNEQSLAAAPRRIETIALDIIDHFTTHIGPGGFKAQIVGCTREVAVLYKEALDRLHGPQSAVVFSSSNKDGDVLVRHHTTEEQRQELIRRFLKPSDPLKILIVCDMLLTGFDAPIEQVMYLDSPLREHTLLQAIARVNRTAEGKTYGLIVDYWGVSEALTEALNIFTPGDVKGAMEPKVDELPRLQARHATVLRFFVGVKDKDDLNACVAALEAEDVRSQFNDAFRKFSQSLDMLLPDPIALPYARDAKWIGKIRQVAASRYRDPGVDISDCGAKVRKLIEEAIAADGIQILVKQISLFAPDFEERLKALKGDDARASEMEHAIRNEIHVRYDENPAFYASLRERLEKLIEDRKAKRIDAAQQLSLMMPLKADVHGETNAARKLGLSDTAFALYGLFLAPPTPGTIAERPGPGYGPSVNVNVDEEKKALATLVEDLLAPSLAIVDWAKKEDVQREMRMYVRRALRVAKVPPEALEAMIDAVMDVMRRRARDAALSTDRARDAALSTDRARDAALSTDRAREK